MDFIHTFNLVVIIFLPGLASSYLWDFFSKGVQLFHHPTLDPHVLLIPPLNFR